MYIIPTQHARRPMTSLNSYPWRGLRESPLNATVAAVGDPEGWDGSATHDPLKRGSADDGRRRTPQSPNSITWTEQGPRSILSVWPTMDSFLFVARACARTFPSGSGISTLTVVRSSSRRQTTR